MKILKKILSINVLIIFLSGNTFVLKNNVEVQNITSSISYLEDKTNKLTFKEAQEKKFKNFNKNFINFEINNSSYWIKINILNKTSQNDFILEITSPFFDKVKLYQKDPNNNFVSKEIGNAINFYDRDILSNLLLFNLNLKEKYSTIYLRIYPGEYKYSYFTINIGNNNSFLTKINKTSLINGIYFGFILLISLYGIILFYTLKEKIFLYYTLCSICFSVVIGHLNGYTFQFLSTSNLWLNKHIDIFNYLLSFFLTLFCMDFLQTKKRTPKLHNGLLIMIAYYFIFIFINLLGYMNISRLGLEFAGAFGIYALILSFFALSQGYKLAKFYIIAQGSFFIFVNIFVLSTLSILPYNVFTANSLQIGSIIEIFFLSFAISEKAISYKRDKENSDKLLIEQSNEFSKKIIEVQEEEKKRVASELHDSLGQNIIIIKNKILSLIKNFNKENLESKLQEITKNIDNISDEVRNISYSLHPYHLKTIGLTESIKDLIYDFSNSSNITFALSIDDIDKIFLIEHQISIYRIIQECMTNCFKHSKATNIALNISKDTNYLTILVLDDGIGFNENTKSNKNGFGIIGIKERLKIINGTLNINSNINKTEIKIIIPIKNY